MKNILKQDINVNNYITAYYDKYYRLSV